MGQHRRAARSVGVDFRLNEFTVSIIKTVDPVFEDALGLRGIAISVACGGIGETIIVLGGLVRRVGVVVAAGLDTRSRGRGRELVVLSALVIGLRLRLGVGSEIANILVTVAGLFAFTVLVGVCLSFAVELVTTRSPRFRRYKNVFVVLAFVLAFIVWIAASAELVSGRSLCADLHSSSTVVSLCP